LFKYINYRLEASEKLGFKNYGELSLITKMAPSISVIENTLMSILEKGIHINFVQFLMQYYIIFNYLHTMPIYIYIYYKINYY